MRRGHFLDSREKVGTRGTQEGLSSTDTLLNRLQGEPVGEERRPAAQEMTRRPNMWHRFQFDGDRQNS